MSESTDLSDLLEIRREITRLNVAAGQTVFNPAATQALNGLIARATAAKELAEKLTPEYMQGLTFEELRAIIRSTSVNGRYAPGIILAKAEIRRRKLSV